MSEIEDTRRWLQNLVIGLNLCPFAHKEVKDDRVRIHRSVQEQTESCLLELVEECQRLDEDQDIGTTLLVYPTLFGEFEDYLDYLALAEELLALEGFTGTYQLASFHPNYCFEGCAPDDPANFTNRSPYPMLHLLREADIEAALEHYPDPEQIPRRNQKLCRELGLAKLLALRCPR